MSVNSHMVWCLANDWNGSKPCNCGAESSFAPRSVGGHVTQTLRGFNGPGWELSVTGSKPWVESMVRKFVPKIQRVASAI